MPSLLKFLRSNRFDTSSEQGRADERYRLGRLTIAANLFARSISMIVMLLSISLTMPYLGAERYGAWMTIVGLAGVLSFLDFGIGNALTNRVAIVASKGSVHDLCCTISSGIALLFIIGFTVSAVLIGFSYLIPWDTLIKVHDINLNKEVNDSAVIFSGLFGLNIFTGGIQKVFIGLQRSFESHLVSSFCSIAILLALLFAVREEAGVPILLLITFGGLSLPGFALIYLLYKRAYFKFSLIYSHIASETQKLIRVSMTFFLLQFCCIFISGADSLIISSQLGAEQVATFAIVMKLFQISGVPISILNAPLWGAYADAHARNEKVFIRKTLKSSMLISIIFSTSIMFTLVIFGQKIVQLFIGNDINIPINLLVVLGFWSIIENVGNTFGAFLNGCNLLKPQIIIVLFSITIGIVAKFILIRLFGIEAMVLGGLVPYILISSIVYGWISRKEIMQKLI